MQFYKRAAPLVERSDDHALKGSFHFEYGLILRRLSAPENREDYLDQALIEYAAASFHFEEAGNERALARVENNLRMTESSQGSPCARITSIAEYRRELSPV